MLVKLENCLRKSIKSVLTYVGVQSGYAIETNAIMVSVVTNPVKLFLFKILLSSVLMRLLSFITQKTKDKFLVQIERFIEKLFSTLSFIFSILLPSKLYFSLDISGRVISSCSIDMVCCLLDFSIKTVEKSSTVFIFYLISIAIQFLYHI